MLLYVMGDQHRWPAASLLVARLAVSVLECFYCLPNIYLSLALLRMSSILRIFLREFSNRTICFMFPFRRKRRLSAAIELCIIILLSTRNQRFKVVRTIEMQLKQNWNKTETKLFQNCFETTSFDWNCFVSVLFRFHFNCADSLSCTNLISKLHKTPELRTTKPSSTIWRLCITSEL